MKRINLSEWALNHQVLMIFFMVLVVVAGVRSYFHLGQNEDPEFTVKTMVVRAYLPGATIEETVLQLSDRIEKKLQETPSLDYLKSYTLPGETTIFVNLLSRTPKSEVPDIWYQVRKKVGDIQHELPAETRGPYFDDEFGDTYGIIYAFTADGFSHRELKDYVEDIRNELLHVPDVAKVTTIGEQDEAYYVEFSPHQLATLGVSRDSIIAALRRQNALTPSGTVDTGKEQIVLEPTGKFLSAEQLANVTLYADGKKVRLGDIAEVRRSYVDPPQPLFRFNGHDAIGLAVSMRKGGDVLLLEKNINTTIEALRSTLPAGIEEHLVANQPTVVHDAVNEFMEALFEAVLIVLGISFLSLGVRAGAVVAFSIPFVLAFVFVGMEICNIDLQRVSLGALIIALGLLVDDAMITVESMVSRLEQGWTKARAATFAYTSTAFPMLTGTLVTIFGFIPIGLAKSSAGEYTFSLFAVVCMALLVSWFVAVLFAPLIGVKVLKEHSQQHKAEPGRVAGIFHRALLAVMRHPKKMVAATLLAFVLALAALPLVPKQFFPSSERPELMVDMTLRQGSSIKETNLIAQRFDAILAADPGVDHWSSYVGRGAIRFYLPLDEQLQNDFFAQTVVVTKGPKEREHVQERLQAALDHEFPELVGRAYAMELGPPVGWPVQYRVSGKNLTQVRKYAEAVAALMAGSPALHNINMNWGEPGRKMRIHVRQDEARRMGLSSSAIAQALYSTVSGVSATQIRDGIYLVDVVLRARTEERTTIEDLQTLDVPLPDGRSVPLGVVADMEYVQDYPLIWRRDRIPTMTVQADVKKGIMPDTVVEKLQKDMHALQDSLPAGYHIETGGSVEESAKSQESVVAAIPIMVLLILTVLIIQLENFRHLVLVICVAPLGVIGVVLGLLITHQPMGFVALLGVVALIGMIIRNSVILVHQIDCEKKSGKSDWDAVVAAATIRFRPIMLTAVAAILGMLPIAPTIFWGPMANAIMGGLATATVLTLLFLPACYVLWFRIAETQPEAGAENASDRT
ncbi:Cobalt-zinc-cadmium resistance protein CzcA [bioreactor metagenome]|uniref:Cobalt-zinc-cadmium resistance protein CzcA n=1 Tax=bioreactor metagenome TaxID=1076179 RepID=A0A644T0Z4_9ZZZZ|nr:efflux RND transporter permease subunit [Desulfovibrio desulfuricans]MEA4990382.1 efflux RND transporter permease subunit [Desulfovibrio desulfuricans]